MLGVDIEFGNNWAAAETSSYKPTKAKTPARTQGFFHTAILISDLLAVDLICCSPCLATLRSCEHVGHKTILFSA
jgi:hypothetical protein